MANPTVNVVRSTNRVHSVKCPISGCGVYIPRNKPSWKEHMIRVHSGNDDTSWDSVYRRASSPGFRDGGKSFVFGHICYGCTSSFESAADLVTHLSAAHGAS